MRMPQDDLSSERLPQAQAPGKADQQEKGWAEGRPTGRRCQGCLNLSQAFNSMGAFLGAMFGSKFLLGGPLFEKGRSLHLPCGQPVLAS
jgi:hypothetical protein